MLLAACGLFLKLNQLTRAIAAQAARVLAFSVKETTLFLLAWVSRVWLSWFHSWLMLGVVVVEGLVWVRRASSSARMVCASGLDAIHAEVI